MTGKGVALRRDGFLVDLQVVVLKYREMVACLYIQKALIHHLGERLHTSQREITT